MVHGSAVSLFRRRYKGLMRPMVLKSRVRASGKSSSNPPCLSEMTAVMACWKVHSFDDVPCRKEIAAFMKCSEEVRANPQAYTSPTGYQWSPDEVNQRLRKFVWAQ